MLVSIPKLQFAEQGKVSHKVATYTSAVLNSFPKFAFQWKLGKSRLVK